MSRYISDREIAIFGGGKIARDYLVKYQLLSDVKYIIDNDEKKRGNEIGGIKILMPGQVRDWGHLFVIITTDQWQEIADQLESYGMEYGRDFIEYSALVSLPMTAETIQKGVYEYFFSEKKESEFEFFVDTREEYEELCRRYNYALEYPKMLELLYSKKCGKGGIYIGYCEICGKMQNFVIRNREVYSWRESVHDEKCKLNSRLRFTYSYIKKRFFNKRIYLYEQVTPLFQYVSKLSEKVTGSEFLSPDLKGGAIVNGVRHEDARALSFENNSFDVMVSCDVLEHISDYRQALNEAYRCLDWGGTLFISIPFYKHKEKSISRVSINTDGSLNYLLEPQYHGNPISEKGSLVYTDFGWDFLDTLKKVGFREVHGLVYYSAEKAYLGRELPMMVIAEK